MYIILSILIWSWHFSDVLDYLGDSSIFKCNQCTLFFQIQLYWIYDKIEESCSKTYVVKASSLALLKEGLVFQKLAKTKEEGVRIFIRKGRGLAKRVDRIWGMSNLLTHSWIQVGLRNINTVNSWETPDQRIGINRNFRKWWDTEKHLFFIFIFIFFYFDKIGPPSSFFFLKKKNTQ